MFSARLAAAQGAPPRPADERPSLIVLRTPFCALDATEVDRFVQLLAIELATAHAQLVKEALVRDAELTIELDGAGCTLPAGEVAVSLVSSSGVRTRHAIALHDVEQGARPRALALAVAELVRNSHSSSEGMKREGTADDMTGSARGAPSTPLTEKNVPHPILSAPATASTPSADAGANKGPDVPWKGDIEASFAARLFAPEATMTYGVDVGVGVRLRPVWLCLRADAAASWTSVDDRLGSIGLSTYGAGLSLVATTGRLPELSFGPRMEIGLARAAGTPTSAQAHASVETQAIASFALTAAARFWFDRWVPFVALDAGTSIARADVYADDRRVAVVGGAFFGLRGGVGVGY